MDFRRRGEQGLFRQSAAPRRPITPTPQQWRAALSSHCGKAETQNGEWSRVTMSLRGKSGLEIQTHAKTHLSASSSTLTEHQVPAFVVFKYSSYTCPLSRAERQQNQTPIISPAFGINTDRWLMLQSGRLHKLYNKSLSLPQY